MGRLLREHRRSVTTGLTGTIHGVLHEVLKGVMIGVGVALVLGALGIVLRYGVRLLRWSRAQIVALVLAVPRARGHRTHARAVRKAAAAGENFVASHRRQGSRTVARWVGAQPEDVYHYHDLVVYQRDVRSGRVPRMRATCSGKAPPVGTRRRVAPA
jgi:hypothetical protein